MSLDLLISKNDPRLRQRCAKVMHELAARMPTKSLVTASAGNWGQALAYCCRGVKIPVTIFAAETANQLKLHRMRALGANVQLSGKDFDAAKHAARIHAEEVDALFIEDGKPASLSDCLLYTSPSPRDATLSRMPSSA